MSKFTLTAILEVTNLHIFLSAALKNNLENAFIVKIKLCGNI